MSNQKVPMSTTNVVQPITPNAQNVTIGSQITLRFLPHQLTIPLFTP